MGARRFYVNYEFMPIVLQPGRLFLPMKTIDAIAWLGRTLPLGDCSHLEHNRSLNENNGHIDG